MNLGLDDNVVAAAVAAAGTVIGALIQLRITWRKEVSERARGVPMTKKSRRGPVLAVGLLLSAAAVGGFAFSQYLMKQSDREAAALRDGELQAQLTQIRATAERLERVTLNDHSSSARTALAWKVGATPSSRSEPRLKRAPQRPSEPAVGRAPSTRSEPSSMRAP